MVSRLISAAIKMESQGQIWPNHEGPLSQEGSLNNAGIRNFNVGGKLNKETDSYKK
jgi:hypothetical protein